MASGSATPRCPRSWMSVAGGCWWQRRPKRPGTAALQACGGPPGSRRAPFGRGVRELAEAPALTAGRVRRAGGGRKPAVESDPDLMRDLKALVEPTARGDPEGPLRWTCKSLRRLADELRPGPSDQPHAGGRVAARARL